MRLRTGVEIEHDADLLTLTGAHGSFTLRNMSDGLVSAMRRLHRAVPLSELNSSLTDHERHQLQRILARLNKLLARCVVIDDTELMSLEPTAPDATYHPSPPRPGARLRLSKFSFARSRDDLLVLESPLAHHRALLPHPAAGAVVAALGTTSGAIELADAAGLPLPVVHNLLAHLIGANLVEVDDPESGRFASETDNALRQWDFHDLLFHSRSRSGRTDDPHGGVFSYLGDIPPHPAIKPPPNGPAVQLPRPSWRDIADRDPQLSTVMEQRVSIREHATLPIDLDQLGEFLYRVARVRTRSWPDGAHYETTTRPYPGGGAAYELEFYLAVHRCDGLRQGIYYYDPLEHRLILINDNESDCRTILDDASAATAFQGNPDIAITITSRFGRLSWKYRGIAYALTLRHVGVLYQSMYLVATAMGLAPCAIGSGNSDAAGRILRLNYTEESPVGEFVLGSRPHPHAPDTD
ncbi:SagB/ThcOx family dehydrogenase [Nocardia panacis]|uniref:SagB/ThcOx family dehydrogenase n=2 Tax=Nocardia panacis TaxID=2340916 RepID=A0A3A4KDF2_9NOCA|nr:SagB/ThcOx family dehydrogenase [Nocardia panacis]